MCRQKKVRCDGEDGKRCTNCITFDDRCTYVHSAPKRRTRPKGYVGRLEQRAAQLEELLNKLCPGFDLLEDFGAAVEESSKINAEQESDEEEFRAGLEHSLSGSGPDFSHAIPPSLGSPPIPAPNSSPSALSAVPSSATLNRHLQGRSQPLNVTTDDVDLLPSDDDRTTRSSLSKRLDQIRNTIRFSDVEMDAESPLSASSHDFDSPGPSHMHARSMSTGSLTRRSSVPPLNQSALTAFVADKRFFGKSSHFSILKTAVDMRSEYWRSAGILGGASHETESDSPKEDQQGQSPLQSNEDETEGRVDQPDLLPCGCPNYGALHPWALAVTPTKFVFPHAALLRSLVATYFDVQNTYVPVLHRPTLERGIASGRHRRDEDFGAVVLLVCALGSRWATERTVLLGVGDDEGRALVTVHDCPPRDHHDHHCHPLHHSHHHRQNQQQHGPEGVPDDFWREGEDDEEWHSAGWKWFKQVRFGRKALYGAPNLLGLQLACLASMYLRGSSSPEASRWITGVGLRLAMDMGAHRGKSYSATPTVEEEQHKRAFWSLLYLDWAISPSLGRPCAIQHEDFDLDLPVECDDEYWEPSSSSSPGFAQPPGKPAIVIAFNCLLRLTQIQAYAQRTIYSTSKSRTILGFVGPQWEERIVAELDSALNSWLDSLPSHLKWDPRNPNTTFLSQSAMLHAAFYNLQITIHRPFIASRRGVPSTTFPPMSPSARFPSLAICTNAARSCVHVSDVLCRRLGQGTHSSLGALHHNMIPLFTSGIVLMLNMWAGNDSRRQLGDRSVAKEMKEMVDVHKAMDMLKVMEVRWHTAGRLWDMLYELAVVWDLPLPSSSHAAVIRSIKQHRGPARGRPSEPDAKPQQQQHQQHQRRATVSVAALQRRATSQSPASGGGGAGRQRMARLDLDVYRTDPAAPWLEYDLSPSVFSQPQQEGSSPGQGRRGAEEPAALDPALDSIFTVRSRDKAAAAAADGDDGDDGAPPADWSRHRPLHQHLHQQRQHPPTWTSNADFGANPVESEVTMVTAAVAAAAVAAPRPAITMDTIAQVLDTIQSRQAEWPVPPPQGNEWPTAGSLSIDAYPPPPPPPASSAFPAGAGAETDAAGVRQETWAMWHSVPDGFDWDEWGTYINAMGSGYPGSGAQLAEGGDGGSSSHSGRAFGAALDAAGFTPP
ncbi:uncharacterized protein PHACADRAFT_262278 [Phanerochaete carnosa HHB-10118-sp]|uniref:Zn(2)-C6 fungal-type domain-containing protein n=1 Tax=Phanerochaete carnosa (strain HHB-10118-sp) TaxID=650164 RepID=K5UPZ6_PHACS|nr:uncharacterized protein PHACADRAFT_262278 [Phanerochaete carnosa HHB-10118-sp]EKM51881.1 hypothetical protein PHACADRAFT_262278 [Phanerochaete carnosa HHB-10118-sp]